MSQSTAAPLAPAPAPSSGGPRLLQGIPRWQLVLGGGVLLIVVLSIVREVTGANELTSSGTFAAVLVLAMPIMLAGLGGLYSERVGIVNIGLEGMMILGTWFGAWAGWKFGAWTGVIVGILGGALGGLVHAVATVTFGIDQVVSGVAINILAAGLARFLSVVAYPLGTGGSASQSPQITGDIASVNIPFLAGGELFGWKSPDILGWLSSHHWLLISDVAGVLRGFVAGVAILTLIALALVPITWWFLWRTRLGLRMRSVGENPYAAESLGVRVYTMKYVGVLLSGGLAGLAGAYLVVESAGIYREGQTGGRGFIGLAALIFGNWRPGGVAAASGLFGYAQALQLRSDTAIHALLLFASIILALLGLWLVIRKGSRWGAAILIVVAAGSLSWFLKSDSISGQFVYITPYVVTLLVLSLASQQLRPPAYDGRPYRRGQLQ
jgi:simple sugar transport system permease protein